MSNADNMCTTILERLKNMQINQEPCRIVSEEFLYKTKNSEGFLDCDSSLEVKNFPHDPEPLLSLNGTDKYVKDEPIHYFSPESTKMDMFKDAAEKSVPPIFPYLKKGRGTARYKSKMLKGFKKKKNPNKVTSMTMNNITIETYSNNAQSKVLSPFNADREKTDFKQSGFEKLEELVGKDSFCSTSSNVLKLLQDSSCSTPAPSKANLVRYTPPTLNVNSLDLGDESYFKLMRNTPICKLFPVCVNTSLENESPTTAQIHRVNPVHFNDHIKNNSNKIIDLTPISRNNVSGILRKNDGTVTPTLKVKFLEQGAKVFEYNDEVNQTQTTTYSEDTDLISISDLDNLVLLNFNVNHVHENTFDDESEEFPTDKVSNEHEGNKNPPKGGMIQTIPRSRATQTHLNLNHQIRTKSSTKARLPLPCDSQENNLEIKAQKTLLVAKVNDLSKEINIFKQKNKIMEELIAEMKREKREISDSEVRSGWIDKSHDDKGPSSSIINDPYNEQTNGQEVFIQLKNLSKKIQKLETENGSLKKKVSLLERENEVKQDIILSSRVNGVESGFRFKENYGDRRTVQCKIGEAAPIHIPQKIFKSKLSKLKEKIDSNRSVNDYCRLGKVTYGQCQDTSGKTDVKIKKKLWPDSVPLSITCKNKLDSVVCATPETPQSPPALDEGLALSLEQNENLLEDCKSQRLVCQLHNKIHSQKKELPPKPRDVEESMEIIDVYGNDVTTLCKTELGCGVIVYPNGDRQIKYPNKTVYSYAKENIIHTIFKEDEREEIEFTTGQKEIYFKDSSYQLIFPDNSSKSVYKDGTEVCVCKDGTVVRTDLERRKSVHFPNGQKEVYEKDGTVQRIFPDGTVKLLYPDGKQETRYANGRRRVKDVLGNVVVYRNSS